MYKQIKQLNLAGLLVAIGFILPTLFHAVPMGGKLFLPMHIPILLAAYLLPYPMAIAVSILTPVLSSLLTGMPPVFPVLPLMLLELFCYVSFIRIFDKLMKLKVVFSLAISLVLGRILLFSFAVIMGAVVTRFDGVAYFVQAISYGVFGIALQLVTVPYAVRQLNRRSNVQGI